MVTLDDGTRILATSHKTIGQTDEPYVLSEYQRHQKWLRHPWLQRFQTELAGGVSNWRNLVRESWLGQFSYLQEEKDAAGAVVRDGLRAAQIGALHAIGAHWTLGTDAATIVMPTGTGKTETMLGMLIVDRPSCLLVVVPSDALRIQVADKFRTLGILPSKGVVPAGIIRPVVGILTKRPRHVADLEVFRRCNVVVATASSIAQGSAEALGPAIAGACSHLAIDEAHHVPAATWSKLKDTFAGKPVLQFTATPFREDAKPVGGKIIYNFPLRKAQEGGFFQPIRFRAVFEADQGDADRAIAEMAVEQLRQDVATGLDHRLMARCNSKTRAEAVYGIYRGLAPDLNPVLVYSTLRGTGEAIERIRDGRSRIVVCVNMLAEGFDLPQLKVAAVHDKHKSLAVLLQFVGRFTRACPNIGTATVVTNTADESSNVILERLYNEDADWGALVADIHFQMVEQHERLLGFLQEAESLMPVARRPDEIRPSLGTLFPKASAVVFNADRFVPRSFFEGLVRGFVPRGAWHIARSNALVIVGDIRAGVEWSSSHEMVDHDWHLYVIYFDQERGLLFVGCSMQGELHEALALAVTGNTARRIQDESIFRVFGNINRLRFTQAGIKKGGGRRHRYSMLTGQDVKDALTSVAGNSASPSNFFGLGFESGHPCTAGCSVKGKVWARKEGNVRDFITWCEQVGAKIRNASFDTEAILGMSLQPVAVALIPDVVALHVAWPDSLQDAVETRVALEPEGAGAARFYECDIMLVEVTSDRTSALFEVAAGISKSRLRMILTGDPDRHYRFVHEAGPLLNIHFGRGIRPLVEYFQDYPPILLFVDGSELEGSLHLPIQGFGSTFPDAGLEEVDWTGVTITEESIWRDGAQRVRSVQGKASELCQANGFDLVFNDDDAGEAADLVCMRLEPARIVVRFVHCKFSHGDAPGARLSDVVEVASQATRCARWKWDFEKLCLHLLHRELALFGKPTRFIVGDRSVIRRLRAVGRYRRVEFEVICVQPGISRGQITDQQRMVLGAANQFLVQTAEVALRVWCAA
jgi:superfamily II DNA or RNA helicase